MRRKPKRLSTVCTGLGIGLLALTGVASADEAASHYRIPAQSLDSSLLRLAADSDLEILFTADQLHGKTSTPLDGTMTPRQALDQLLKGSGYTYHFVDNHTVTLDKALVENKKAEPTVLKTVKVSADSIRDVTDDYNNTSYTRTNTTTATKTDTPIMQTPMSIQVVPRAVMDDQQVISLKDALQNVSGVQWSPVEGNLYENFVLRGFDANSSTLRNGIRESSFSAETANIAHIEVLKGPSAMLYGRVEPGGIINRVTKDPLFTPYYSVQQQFGSFSNYRNTVDATGPISSEVAYRFNMAYQNNKSYRDFVGNERIFLAPSVTWKPSTQTELGLTLEYQYDNGRWDDGIPALGNRPANVPISRYLGDPISNDKQERELIDFHWSHQFNKDWKINQRFVTSLATYDQFNIFPWSLNSDNTMNLGLWNSHAERNTYSQNINLVDNIEGWGAKHTILTGFDFYTFDAPGAVGNPTTGPLADGTALQNLYNPIYGQFNATVLHGLPANSYGTNNQTWYGIYLQDQIQLWEKLHFLLGGRYDWATIGTSYGLASASEASVAANNTAINADKFSPRFGILYQPWSWMSVYGNYTESLGANNGRNLNNTPLKPQEGRGFEAGIKNEFLDGRISSTLAYFDINKTNIQAASADPVLALQGYSTAIGQARSRGLEYDFAGKMTDNWSFIANYAWTNTRILKDGGQYLYDSAWNTIGFNSNGYTGNRLPLAPLHSANLWLKYEFTDSIMKGFSIGSGTRIASQSQGDPANDFQLPGYVTWNAMAAYKHKLQGGATVSAQINAYNLLDKRYYFGTDQVDGAQRFNIIPAAPVNVMGSIRLEY